uniref:Putative F-box/kelch-repeat protein n=1 Tax=Noccaea caerulescens TaxID=107243 RepID=A0A1J3EX93_NOCCA
MSNSDEPSQKKRNMQGSPSSSLLSSLPDDVALNCLARVSRLDRAALSLASKSYRSLVASPDFDKIRSQMGRTETYVYVCIRTPPPDPNLRWYILRRRKTREGSSSDLIPISSLPSQPSEASSVVALDWGIYVIGGLIKGKPTTDVWLLDCRSHTWRSVPSMGVARAYAAAGVVDGKIYVLGGCDVVKFGEVLDPKTQTWETLALARKNGNKIIHDSVVRDQKVYAVDGTDETFYYSPREGKWGSGNSGQVTGNRRDWCMVDNLICCLSRNGTIFWCEPDELDWRGPEEMMNTKEVKGLGSLNPSLLHSRVVHFGEKLLHRWHHYKIKYGIRPPLGVSQELEDLLPGARLSNSGGNILLFWDVINGDRLEIWCAEISLERRPQGGEIWGNIEWSNAVMTVNPFIDHHKVLHSVSVTL